MTNNGKIPLQVEIYGEPGVGKTHFCTTSPDPIIIDVSPTGESRVNSILSVCNYIHCSSMKEIRDTVEVIKDDGDFKTVCIDSSTHLQPITVSEWLVKENAHRKKVDKLPLNTVYPITSYGKIRKDIDDIFVNVLNNGMNLILTSQMGDQYIGDKNTGRRVSAGYAKLDYQSHIRLRMVIKNKERICIVKKNRFVDVLSEKYFKIVPNPTFDNLVDMIIDATGLSKDNFIL